MLVPLYTDACGEIVLQFALARKKTFTAKLISQSPIIKSIERWDFVSDLLGSVAAAYLFNSVVSFDIGLIQQIYNELRL